ncbi:MAG: NAD+ synthase [Burkholderiales bacterium]|nr:MAG: NAD+ synthase [Burkholderiales bacterium]
MPLRVAAAQLNQIVGDFGGNLQRILASARCADAEGANVLLTPELALVGYPPEDLLLRPAFYRRAEEKFVELVEASRQWPRLTLVVGQALQRDGRRYNAACAVRDGAVLAEYHKRDLPNYDVFDEQRYFAAGEAPVVLEIEGVKVGLAVCEDVWFAAAPQAARAAGAEVLLVLNASPFHANKHHQRIDVARANVCSQGMSLVAANMVGGQDELVFDGMSFALDADGSMTAQAAAFEEDLLLVDFDGAVPSQGRIEPLHSIEEQIYGALVLGVRDYIGKNGFPGAIIGLSGGIDSALTLAIAVDALGSDRVRTLMMPSPYTADMSLADAREMALRLGVRYDVIGIEPMFAAFLDALADDFAGLEPDATEENIQARIRGTLLMALSNKHGAIVLTTGNKSELATGYCTLYGDMAGGFAVIKDIAKTMVYRLALYRNGRSEVIPERIITRPPSAELRPDQTDQDSLPPYEVLDPIMQMYMEQNRGVAEIVGAGYARDVVDRVVRLLRLNEYKRRQAPVGIRVTHRGFGRDWRYPITSRFIE